MDADLFERWFVIADQDHDGMVSGSEAVEFFGRSNLSQDTLFQVSFWSCLPESHSCSKAGACCLHQGHWHMREALFWS